jgi:glycosyltransferase 2 family protein
MLRPARLLAALITPVFAVWCVLRFRSDISSMSFGPLLHAWNLLLLAAALSLGNYLLRTLRWRWYLAALGHRPPLDFLLLTYFAGFAYTLSPAKLGELMRARYYARIGIPTPDITAAFLAERLMDGLAIAALATLTVGSFLPWRQAGWVAVGCTVSIAVLLALLVRLGLRRAATWGAGSGVTARLANHASNLISSGRALFSANACAIGLGIGVAAWGLEGVGLGVLSRIDPQVHLAMLSAVGIYSAAVLAGALSFVPGGLGSTEAVLLALLAAHGTPAADALLITLTCRIVTLWFAVALGWLAVLALRLRLASGVACHAQS